MLHLLKFVTFFAAANSVLADDFLFAKFPGDFSWGIATSVYETGAYANYSGEFFLIKLESFFLFETFIITFNITYLHFNVRNVRL